MSSDSTTARERRDASATIAVRSRRTPLREHARELVRATIGIAGRRTDAGSPQASAAIDVHGAIPRDLADHWERVLVDMLRRTRAAGGNAVQVFTDGDELFERMWTDIDAARRQVWVETYILEDDRVGRRTIDGLAAAARRGCETILFVDAFGSGKLPFRAMAPIVEGGGRVCVFNPPRWRWLLRRSPLQRNHRKLTVIDGCVGYVGGMNISEDYAGLRHGRGTFRDCQLRIVGPAVRVLGESMADVLCEADVALCPVPLGEGAATPTSSARPGRGGATLRQGDDGSTALIQVLESAGRTGRRQIQREMRVAINAARRTLDIATPYFVPPRPLYEAMKAAARRGARVRLLVAGRSDAPIVTLAARHVYDGLLRRGVRVFELHDATLHAKTAVFDGVYAMVGSFNLDRWSDKRNLEIKVGIVDPATIAALEAEFESLVRRAVEITSRSHAARSWGARVAQWLAYHAMRV
ncbi:MAG: phosphatidylserine/phosphatidylglycerophosphate/cardiolipin synthase family protein [Phycisphaerales bacterium]